MTMSNGARVRPPCVPVTGAHRDVRVAKRFQSLFSVPRERLDDLDCVHMRDKLRQHGRLISRAGSDFEHAIAAGWPRQLGHQRDDVGLGNGLLVTDRKRSVVVCLWLKIRKHEEMTGDLAHRRQHARVAHVARRNLLGDHPFARTSKPVLARDRGGGTSARAHQQGQRCKGT